MEYILRQISLNKVNIPIITNSYEEINTFVEEENLFNNIENIIDIYQSMKPNKQYYNGSTSNNNTSNNNTSNNNTSNNNTNNVKYNKSVVPIDKPIEGFNSLILCILEIIDQSVSLLNNITKMEKIKNFKNMMVLNLDMIKLHISRDDMKKAIENEDNIICVYFAFLLKKNIAVFKDNDIEIYGNFDDCISINYEQHLKLYKICDTYTTGPIQFFKELMINKRIEKMLENDIIEKLNTFLLKDLKDIADKIKIPIYKLEGNKKKNLLKNELKDIIKQKFEEYK